MGRPKLSIEQKKTYSRIAVSPETHIEIKRLARKANLDIIVWFDIVTRMISNSERIQKRIIRLSK
jgi:queuine/archaeosine tRNA-ribosyltransferase